MACATLLLIHVHGLTKMSKVTTSCGVDVLAVTGAKEATLNLAPFLSPPTETSFVYLRYDRASDSSLPPDFFADMPFVYADMQSFQVDDDVVSATWTTDDMSRLLVNGNHLYASHKDQAISLADPVDSQSVSEQWPLVSVPDFSPYFSNCPAPSAPPPPSIPCGNSGVLSDSLCDLFFHFRLCYCNPAEVSAAFASVNYQAYEHCQGSCGCCYSPPMAPSSPSPPPPLAPFALQPCILNQAAVGSRCFVQIEIVGCAHAPGRECLIIDKPFFAAFVKARCYLRSDESRAAVAEPCFDDMNLLGQRSELDLLRTMRSAGDRGDVLDATALARAALTARSTLATGSYGTGTENPRRNFARYVNYFPSVEGFLLSAATLGHDNSSTAHWPMAPPVSATNADLSMVVREGYELEILPTRTETRVYESPLSTYTPNVAIYPPLPPPPPKGPPARPPRSPPAAPAPPFPPPSPPPLCSFWDSSERCGAQLYFEDSNSSECTVSVDKPVDELRFALSDQIVSVRVTEVAAEQYLAIHQVWPSTDSNIPGNVFLMSRKPKAVDSTSQFSFEPFPPGFPIAHVNKVVNCSYTKSLIDCSLYQQGALSQAGPVTQAVFQGDLYNLECYDIPRPPSSPPSPPVPQLPMELRVCQGFRIVNSKTSAITNYYRQWTFFEYLSLGVLHQCDDMIMRETDPAMFGCYDMASPEALGGDFVSDGEIDILDWNANAKLRNEPDLGADLYMSYSQLEKSRYPTPESCANYSESSPVPSGRRLAYESRPVDCSELTVDCTNTNLCFFHCCTGRSHCNHTLIMRGVSLQGTTPPRAPNAGCEWREITFPNEWQFATLSFRSSSSSPLLSECTSLEFLPLSRRCFYFEEQDHPSCTQLSFTPSFERLFANVYNSDSEMRGCHRHVAVWLHVAENDDIELDFDARSVEGQYPETKVDAGSGYLNLVPSAGDPPASPPPPSRPFIPETPPGDLEQSPCPPAPFPGTPRPPPSPHWPRADTSNCTVEDLDPICRCEVSFHRRRFANDVQYWEMQIQWHVSYLSLEWATADSMQAWCPPNDIEASDCRTPTATRYAVQRPPLSRPWPPNTPLMHFRAKNTPVDSVEAVQDAINWDVVHGSGHAIHATFALDENGASCRMSLYANPPPLPPPTSPLPPGEPPTSPSPDSPCPPLLPFPHFPPSMPSPHSPAPHSPPPAPDSPPRPPPFRIPPPNIPPPPCHPPASPPDPSPESPPSPSPSPPRRPPASQGGDFDNVAIALFAAIAILATCATVSLCLCALQAGICRKSITFNPGHCEYQPCRSTALVFVALPHNKTNQSVERHPCDSRDAS